MKRLKDYEKYHERSKLEKSLNTLKGIVQGISIDGVINQDEITELLNWCSLQAEHRDKHPYIELLPMIEEALKDNILTPEECSDILWVCNNFLHNNTYYDYITASIQQLNGIIHGVLADNVIDDNEISRLMDWVNINGFLRGTYPFDELDSILTSILADGRISELERNQLKAFLGEFVDTTVSFNISQKELEELRKTIQITGICATCPEIEFKNKVFCFTGESCKCRREEISHIIFRKGGIYNDIVTRKTDYLIVGSKGNPCWAFCCYGRKVEQAVQIRKAGGRITIVHENDFWDAIG